MSIASRIGEAPVLAAAAAFRELLATCELGLFTNGGIPVDWSNVEEYEEPVTIGYTRLTLEWMEPTIPVEGVVRWFAEPPTWEPDPDAPQVFVNGWFLFSPELGQVVVASQNATAPFVTTGPFSTSIEFTTAYHLL